MLIGGRYSREGEIGRGGMGAVWLGRDEVLGREVAIKRVGMMPGGSSPDLLRAEREARIAASLNHPHVVGIYDLVHDHEQQWLIMEYISGTTLGGLVRGAGALSVEQLAPILAQAAEALAAAHAAGIVHRDVKPSNILVREDGQAKISDFGIARAVADESLTQTGLVTGSPAYLAPEVASGQHARTASDVWSLGATAFHALAGHPPYDVGDNVLGAMYRIVHEAPPRFEGAGEMGILLEATMAHDPESRWTMSDVVRFLDGLRARAPRVPDPIMPLSLGSGDGDGGTQVMQAAPPVDPPAFSPVPSAPPAASEPSPRRRVRLLPVLVGLLVVSLLVAIVLLALTDDPQRDPDLGGPGSTPSSSDSPSPTETESSAAPTKAGMEEFIASYIAAASSDPQAGFEQLTADFKQESGGLSGYTGFWGQVTNATIDSVDATPKDLIISYRYSYDYPGRSRATEDVTLQLVQKGDSFLIAGEA